MNWDSLDWAALDRLRAGFLDPKSIQGPYWRTWNDLAAYDLTYAERIGWKWDAVLRELTLRRWTPTATGEPIRILDWGCGSGVAGRRVLAWLSGQGRHARLAVWDHSPLARDFAVKAARQTFPGTHVDEAPPEDITADLLVVSHVLNELDENAREKLRSALARVQAVIWIEPGTREVARELQTWRDQLVSEFFVWAPCTHAHPCPLRAIGRERDWCHHFAAPPSAVFADRNWVKFGQRAGIDLRGLPYSYLVLDRATRPETEGLSRVLGRPEHFKPYARVLNCDAQGAAELTIAKRSLPELYKQLDRTKGPLLYRWTHDGHHVASGEPV